MTFVFDKTYANLEQVAPWLDAFNAVYDEILAGGGYPYNDSFKGRIPGIFGPNENTGIYLLQGLRREREQAARVVALREQGYADVEKMVPKSKVAYSRIVLYSTGRGGQVIEHENARLVSDAQGVPYAVLPKGKVKRGYRIDSRKVLALA